MGATFSSSKSPTYIYPATQSSNPPTRIYRIEVYKICRLVKQLNEDERKPTGVRVIIKINSMQISDHSASFDIPYPPSVYQKKPSELRLRPMLLNTKTSITSLRSAIFKSDTIAQSIVNHPQQPLKVDRPGLEKVKYVPTSRINAFQFDKHYDVKDIVTAIDATINEVCSPTPMERTVTRSESTAAPSDISSPIRLIQRPFTTNDSFILPQSGASNRIDTVTLARASLETLTRASSKSKARFYMGVKAEASPATTKISFRSTLTSEVETMGTTVSEPVTVISTPEAPKLDKMQIVSTSSDSIQDITFGSLNSPVPIIANRYISGASYIKPVGPYHHHPIVTSSTLTCPNSEILKNADIVFSPEKIKASTPNTVPPLTIIKPCRPRNMAAPKLPTDYDPFSTRDMCVNITTPLNIRKVHPTIRNRPSLSPNSINLPIWDAMSLAIQPIEDSCRTLPSKNVAGRIPRSRFPMI
ncbi:hypothetical protein J010_05756 [Cryptococcus neoformans]|nr:hypothetical protein C355_05699 [Cryptococcus neoformans var. grubii Th84]OXG74273.1 hypothetical protein C350_05684 [Cryptococcus neoformans var. grubii MW-RSA36]OXH03135.1 hypothetical protein J010_05756 [Cryptococcus neoformans var. grubii]OXL05805.1 hypothetical protein C348_05925 [Cryptococcus neoformans var. grubii Gb118]OXH25068.1 hypothetical protein J009_05746 [Cryptococcus neoformans var. grubii]